MNDCTTSITTCKMHWQIEVKSNSDKSRWEVYVKSFAGPQTSVGFGATPQEAYSTAIKHLILKPWLQNPPDNNLNYYNLASRVKSLLADNSAIVKACLKHAQESHNLSTLADIIEIRAIMTEICRKEY